MIGVLVFPGFQLLDAAGPISVFEIAARLTGKAPSIKLIAVRPGPVRSSARSQSCCTIQIPWPPGPRGRAHGGRPAGALM